MNASPQDLEELTLINPAAKSEPYAEKTTIDPETAEWWLNNNVRNRNVRDNRVRLYTAAMERGEWVYGPTLIAFDVDGALINGQHTLLAVVEANVSIPVIVAYNCPREAYSAFDNGLNRKTGDVLRASGEASATTLASALRWGYRFELAKELGISITTAGDGSHAPSTLQLQDLLEENPEVRDSINVINKAAREHHLSHGAMAWIHYEMGKVDYLKANEFFYILQTGEYPSGHPMFGRTLGERNPIRGLRNTLRANRDSKRRYGEVVTVALVIKAANYWYHGQERKVLVYKDVEEFPTIDWAKKGRQ